MQESDRAPVLWLELLLRQHELCSRSREHPAERRVVLVGGSGPFGFPYSAEYSVSGFMNESPTLARLNAHVFNLAMVYPNLTKAALIARKALDYDPNVIIYGVTLREFQHFAPSRWLPTRLFYRENYRDLSRFAADSPEGISEPVERNSEMASGQSVLMRAHLPLREIGLLATVAIQHYAEGFARWVYARPRGREEHVEPDTDYDCETTLRRDSRFDDWQEWNVLLYLAQLQREEGVDVLVVNWPIRERSKGECFNMWYSKRRVAEYSRWMQAETQRQGLRYLDFMQALPFDELFGDAHVRAEGNERLAGWIVLELESILSSQRESAPALRHRP